MALLPKDTKIILTEQVLARIFKSVVFGSVLICDVVSAARLGAAFGEAWVSADRCVETTHATANQNTPEWGTVCLLQMVAGNGDFWRCPRMLHHTPKPDILAAIANKYGKKP